MGEKSAWPVLLGLIVTITCGTDHAQADMAASSPRLVMASRDGSAALGAFRSPGHLIRRERVVRHRFRGPRIIGIDGSSVAIPVPGPVPQEEEVYPIEPSFGGFGYRPMPPPAVIVAPQIITLPTSRAIVRKIERHEARSSAPNHRTHLIVVRRHVSKFDVMAWRPFAWPVAYTCGPYAVGIVPIGFSPCDDQPHSAIYNTPCGTRPYD
jgi:hypothetical protein